jgi:hypothetical protein
MFQECFIKLTETLTFSDKKKHFPRFEESVTLFILREIIKLSSLKGRLYYSLFLFVVSPQIAHNNYRL